MNYREKREELEKLIYCELATCSVDSKGREIPEEKCKIRTEFQRDRDRIIHSKSFRRLKHKTQVFISPNADHFRTRLTHTLEVSQIARTIARALEVNEDFVEAIALGHDLGHTPFGHSGEFVLDELNSKGFIHAKQSVRVVNFLERNSKNRIGLNLTKETIDGILNHTGGNVASTLEGRIIKFADRIAYINHDIDDAIRAGILREDDLPKGLIEILGNTHSKRINTMINGIISESYHRDDIVMEPKKYEATMELRQFMFKEVYNNRTVKSEEGRIKNMLTYLFEYYMKDISRVPEDHLKLYENMEIENEDIVTDYIAGMTDRYAVLAWKELFIPRSWG